MDKFFCENKEEYLTALGRYAKRHYLGCEPDENVSFPCWLLVAIDMDDRWISHATISFEDFFVTEN